MFDRNRTVKCIGISKPAGSVAAGEFTLAVGGVRRLRPFAGKFFEFEGSVPVL